MATVLKPEAEPLRVRVFVPAFSSVPVPRIEPLKVVSSVASTTSVLVPTLTAPEPSRFLTVAERVTF
jgi:hypothetical protein